MAVGSGALFGNTGSRSQNKNLVEFKAGKMELKGNMVHPDKRKGLVFVHQTDDSLMHFCWKDRTSGTVVDDLIIFPDDVEYKRVPQCTTGRVFVLKFKSTHRKLFFWMQEPKSDKDEEYCKKVNEYLNNPPALGSSRSGGSTPGGLPSELSNLGDSDVQTLLNNMSQQQLMQLFGNVGGMNAMSSLSSLLGSRPSSVSSSQSTRTSTTSPRQETAPSTTTAATTTTTTTTTPASTITATTTATTPTATTTTTSSANSGQIQLSDLQNILSGISVPASGDDQARADLSSAFNADALQPILSNTDFIERLQALLPQVESGGTTDMDQVRSTLQSPQFQQAMSTFSAALQSGQLGPLMQQFGLGDDAVSAAAQGDIEAFVRALQLTQAKQNPEGDSKKPSQDKKDDDEDMSLD